MAQKMIELKKLLKPMKNVAIQTDDKDNELYFSLSKSKHCRVYYSECYKDFVLSFNINHSKNFIMTRKMWKIFKFNLVAINNILHE